MKNVIIDAREIKRIIFRIAHEIIERMGGSKAVAIVGIQRRGVFLARRIARLLEQIEKNKIPVGALDITLYRDDVDSIAHQPLVRETNIPFSIDGKKIILVDDVLHTGRSARAAMDALIDLGRPKAIKLAVLVERGGREFPIQADYIGYKADAKPEQLVHVLLTESDGKEEVVIE